MSSGGHGSHPRTQSASSQSREGSRIPEEDSEGNDTDGDVSNEDLHDDEETGLTTRDRRRKQRRKRHNTQLDNRIVNDRITAEEKKEADKSVIKKLLVDGTLILLWYLFSLSISLVRTALTLPTTQLRPVSSTTSGCLTSKSSTFLFHSSLHPCICWYSLRSHA